MKFFEMSNVDTVRFKISAYKHGITYHKIHISENLKNILKLAYLKLITERIFVNCYP